MPFAIYHPDGNIQNVPAAVDSSGRTLSVGYDPIEDVTKTAMMVWNPNTLAWERATSLGGGGGGGEAVNTTKRVDVASSTVTYVGDAAVGTLESASGWLIKKITFDANGNVTSVLIAAGVWSNRAGLTYA